MWKYCGKISQLGFFILYIIFYSFISFSSTHMSSIPLLLFIFLLQNLPTTSHLLFSVPQKKKIVLLIREKRETETEREEKDWERSAWASTTCISTTAPTSPPPGWVRSACFFFFFQTCLFWFKFILRIGFCFVVCVLCLD